MQYRSLGRSGLKISPICLGTMMFGGPTDEATSNRIVAKAREAGVNFIDTADAYSMAAPSRWSAAPFPTAGTTGCSRPNSPIRWATIPIAAGCRGAGCCRRRKKA